nr:MAG TPA: hypothetical protein [Bacteriophage sp.]
MYLIHIKVLFYVKYKIIYFSIKVICLLVRKLLYLYY